MNKDIKKLKALILRYKDMCYHDDLTGLYNHRKLERDLKKICYDKLRYHTRFSIIMIDLDRFKEVNDTKGHEAGDRLLITVANTLKDVIRPTDRVYRKGGDEFIVILFHTTQRTARRVAKRIKDALPCKASVGIAIGKDTDEVMNEADKKMYEDKRRKR